MNEPAKKPKKPRAPRKTKKPSADATDPFVPDEFGVIPPQTGDGLTIKGVPLVFVPGEAETIQGALNSAFLETQLERRHPATFPNSLLPAGKDFEAISQPTSANFIGSLENTEQAPGKTEPTDGSSQSPLPTNSANEKNQGDIAIGPAVADSNSPADSLESVLPPARARDGETKGQCRERLRQEARTSGMTRRDAISYAGRMVEQVWFPPPEPVIEPVIIEEIPDEPELEPPISSPIGDISVEPVAPPAPPAPDLGVSGLGELPESWGNLPANAQLQVEIAWVSANRLRVRSGNGVDLARALSPAPSYSALSWLETSILFPSKFADISVKATADQDDEREHIKREKLAIEEIRSILAEMLEG